MIKAAYFISTGRMKPEEILINPEGANFKGDALIKAILDAMDEKPWAALQYTSHYIKYLPQEQRAGALIHAMEKDPFTALGYTERYITYLPSEQRAGAIREAMKELPWAALQKVPKYIEYIPPEQRTEALIDAIKAYPPAALYYAQQYIQYIPEAQRAGLLLHAMEEAPSDALTATRYIEYLPFDQRGPALIRAVEHQVDNLGIVYRVDETISAYLSPETAALLERMSITKQKNLAIGHMLNQYHTLPTAARFARARNFTAAEFYELMVFGREELYTTSYTGTFERFIDRMKEEGHRSIFEIADPAYKNSPLFFLEMASEYGTLDKAIEWIPKEKWGDVLNLFAARIDHADVQAVANFAEIMQKTSDLEVRAQMETLLRSRYEASPPGNVRDAWAVAASYYNQLAGKPAIALSDPDRYRLEFPKSLSADQVFGADGVHRQLMAFTESGDGVGLADFEGFMRLYRNNDAYTIEDKGQYVKIVSRGEKNKIEIYANRPSESPDEILKAVSGNENAQPGYVGFDSVIHRGHSTKLYETMPYLTQETRFVWLGSCGGFSHVGEVLRKSPGAQIGSTHQLGTRYVNEPMLYHINESIRKNGTVVWEKEQHYLDGFGSQEKEGYVLPHRNAALMIKERLNALRQQNASPEIVPSSAVEAPEMVPPVSAEAPESWIQKAFSALCYGAMQSTGLPLPCAPPVPLPAPVQPQTQNRQGSGPAH